ncbi:ATP synthase F1 subunit delta [Flavobacteriales bacterium]|nr:ATP synthase F1 subunit delta [Flavobacteriales bacterium]
MIYKRAAHRYAKATLKSCLSDKNELDLVFQDMKNISVSFENSKELKLFVDSKVVKDLDKLNALKSVFKNSSNKTKDLMELLMKNKRIDLFDDVANSFIMLYNKYAQNQEVVLTSSSHLRSSTIKEIETKVRNITNKNITLLNKIDVNIVGGFILRIGDLQYDASFKNQLNKLKQDFINISIQ